MRPVLREPSHPWETAEVARAKMVLVTRAELDGLQVMETVGAGAMPLTVFVTAYDEHAIRAFEANALDYLLKPFSDERWEAALARAKARHDELSLREFGRGVLRMLATRSQARRYLDRLVVKGSGTTRFIRVADIDWIESAGVYVNLHIAGDVGRARQIAGVVLTRGL